MGSSENSRQSVINRWTLDYPASVGCLQSSDHATPSAENYKSGPSIRRSPEIGLHCLYFFVVILFLNLGAFKNMNF